MIPFGGVYIYIHTCTGKKIRRPYRNVRNYSWMAEFGVSSTFCSSKYFIMNTYYGIRKNYCLKKQF